MASSVQHAQTPTRSTYETHDWSEGSLSVRGSAHIVLGAMRGLPTATVHRQGRKHVSSRKGKTYRRTTSTRLAWGDHTSAKRTSRIVSTFALTCFSERPASNPLAGRVRRYTGHPSPERGSLGAAGGGRGRFCLAWTGSPSGVASGKRHSSGHVELGCALPSTLA